MNPHTQTKSYLKTKLKSYIKELPTRLNITLNVLRGKNFIIAYDTGHSTRGEVSLVNRSIVIPATLMMTIDRVIDQLEESLSHVPQEVLEEDLGNYPSDEVRYVRERLDEFRG